MDAAASVARASRIRARRERARKKRIRYRRVFCGTRGKRMVRARALLFLSFFLYIFRYLSVRRSPKNKNNSLSLSLPYFLSHGRKWTRCRGQRYSRRERALWEPRNDYRARAAKDGNGFGKDHRKGKKRRRRKAKRFDRENKKWSAKSGNACKATARSSHRHRMWLPSPVH